MSNTANLLLNYQFSSSPSPIQTSTTANLNIYVSGANIYCSQVVVAAPTGPDSGNLFVSPPTPTAACNTTKWSITAELKKASDLGLPGDTTYTTFTFDCIQSSDNLIDYNLDFLLSGTVNGVAGDFDIQIMETSGTSASDLSVKQGSQTLSSVAPQFYLQNFVSTSPGTPTVPVTDFTAGASIYFEWESNGTYFQLYQQGNPTPIYQGTATNFTLSDGINRGATFVLAATLTGPIGQGGASGYEPIFLYDSLTVTVSNPVLTPSSVTVSGPLSVTGAATLASATVQGALSVTGNTTLAGTTTGALTAASGNVQGGFSVTGDSTLAATTAGALTAASASIQGNLSVSGLLSASGAVGMMGSAASIGAGNYTAPSDGFVSGFVGAPSDASLPCITWIFGSNGSGLQAAACGGNTIWFFHWSSGSGDNSWFRSGSVNNSFTLPVSKGSSFSVSVSNDGNNSVNANVTFYWTPVGSGSVSMPERTGDAPPPPHANSHIARINKPADVHGPSIDKVVDALADAMGDNLKHAQREKLHKAIKELVYLEGWIIPR